MQFLNRIKIQTRIIILVLLPLLVTFLLSIERLNNAQTELENLEKLDVALDYSHITAPYVSDVLIEAFYSRLYIDSKPEKADEYREEMEKAQAITKKQEVAYINFIESHKDELAEFQVLNQHIVSIRQMVDKFKYVRAGANNKVHASKEYAEEYGYEVHTMWEMIVLIRRLVLSLSEIVVLASENPELGRMSNAYYNLIVANAENSFQNSFIFAAMHNALDIYIFGEIYNSSLNVGTSRDLFLNYATPKGRAAYEVLRENKYFKQGEEVALWARTDIYGKANKPLTINDDIDWGIATAEIFKAYEKTMDVVLNELIDTKNNLISEAETRVYQTMAIMLTLIILISIVSYFIGHSITNPLKAIVRSFSQLSKDKDMAIKLKERGTDELAELSKTFNDLIDSFNTTLSHVKAEAKHINESTNNVADSMNESLSLSDNQLHATDSISVAINQMTATIEEVANMATHTSDAVQKAHDISVASSENAQVSQHMMENLTLELGKTSEVVNSLNQETGLIGNVLNVIQGIAEQTNLLALNAAIEAARAGDMGRGFAVVADEVRSLAGRTQESTEQIRQQIEALQKGAEAATLNMENLKTEGEKAVGNVEASAEAVNTMKAELDNIMQMAEQIATASEEQTCVSNEINERIVAIRDDADKITSKTNETASSAQGLKETGVRLNEYISEFKIDEGKL